MHIGVNSAKGGILVTTDKDGGGMKYIGGMSSDKERVERDTGTVVGCL